MTTPTFCCGPASTVSCWVAAAAILGSVSLLPVAGRADIPHSDPSHWQDLISFRPKQEIQKAVSELSGKRRGAEVQKLEDAWSNKINLDFYSVFVAKPPEINGKRLNPSEIKEYVRLNLSSFMLPKHSVFWPYKTGRNEQDYLEGKLGAYGVFDIRAPYVGNVLSVEYAVVVLSDLTDNRWRFTPINDGSNAYWHHPVSGTREFGVTQATQNGKQGIIFYTRAADRGTLFVDLTSIAFPAADDLWRSMQQLFKKWVEDNNGTAEIVAPTRFEPAWSEVKRKYWKPRVKWISDQAAMLPSDRRKALQKFAAQEFRRSGNHCESFATVAGYATSLTDRTREWLDDMRLVIIGESMLDRSKNRGAWYLGVRTRDSGFKPSLKDGSSQVEHAMAAIYLAKVVPPGGVDIGGTAYELYNAYKRKEVVSAPDIALWAIGGDIGARLSDRELKGVGRPIRTTMCE